MNKSLPCVATVLWHIFFWQSVSIHIFAASISPKMDINLTAHDILQALQGGHLTSEELVLRYLAQINRTNHYLRAVLQVSPTLIHDAKECDRERQDGSVRGPLHGLPILVKVGGGT